MHKNEWNESIIRKFEMENPDLLKNNLVISFLKIPTNKEVYLKTISNPTPENMNELDVLFKHFYFKIRFISHISTTLKFNAINYDKRSRLIESRFPTILYTPLNSSEGEDTLLDVIADEQMEYDWGILTENNSIDEHISCPMLLEAINSLTEKQKEIINLAYAKGLSDTEIGLTLNKTQQAVSKTHKKALENMLTYIENQREKE